MPPVTLHQPAEGLDRGDTYSGPNEDWLVREGYASRAKDADGTHVTSGSAKNDQTLAVNRETPAEGPPQPKTETTLVDGNPSAFQPPKAPDALDSRQPRQAQIDAKLKEVAAGKRDPNAPDVVLEDAQKAMIESRDYDGSTDEAVLKRQQAEEKASLERLVAAQDERTKEAVKAERTRAKEQMLDQEHVAGQEKVLMVEDGVGTDATLETTSKDNEAVGDTPRNPLLDQLAQLDPKESVSKVADVTKAPDKPRSTKADAAKGAAPRDGE